MTASTVLALTLTGLTVVTDASTGFLTSSAQACGISTHLEVAHRATWWFDGIQNPDYAQYISQYPEAIQGGASYPDWGYVLPNYGDAGEEAHWDPFLKQAADYVFRTYPLPWDRETERLAVFLFAVSAHSVADISWHGLGVDEGFIDVLAAQDFHGDWGAAHTAADTGGDMVAAYQLDQSYMLPSAYVPTDDMVKVYHELGYDTVNRQVMTLANFLIFVGAQAERLAGQLLYPTFARNSPQLTDLYLDYFAGGLDDMSTFSAWKWDQMIDWMENGVEGSRYNLEPDHEHLTSHDYFVERGLKMIEEGELEVTMEKTPRGVIFHAKAPERKTAHRSSQSKLAKAAPHGMKHGARAETPVLSPRVQTADSRLLGTPLTFQTDVPYAHLGTGLAHGDFNRDGLQDLVIGAPAYGGPGEAQHGLLSVIFGRKSFSSSIFLLPANDNITLEVSEEYSRLGWRAVAVDINADGFDDLAVAAPTTQARALQYYGEVLVYLGGTSGMSTTPDITFTTLNTYTNLGHTLSAGDANGDGFLDLLVGAPYARAGGTQRGLAAVFLSRSTLKRGDVLDLDDADWLETGEQDYDWFGHALEIAVLSTGERILLVGAPGVNLDDAQSVGRLYGYSLSGIQSHTASLTPRVRLTGSSEFAQMGAMLAVGDPYGTGYPVVALSSPTWGDGTLVQAGAVSLYPVHELVGELSTDSQPPVVNLRGGQDFARFGASLLLSDLDNDGRDDLWVGAPNRRTNAGAEGGACFYWPGSGLPVGTIRNAEDQATTTLEGQEVAGRLGSGFTALDFDGNGVQDLVVAARQSGTLAAQAGKVFAYTTGTLAKSAARTSPRPPRSESAPSRARALR